MKKELLNQAKKILNNFDTFPTSIGETNMQKEKAVLLIMQQGCNLNILW